MVSPWPFKVMGSGVFVAGTRETIEMGVLVRVGSEADVLAEGLRLRT